MCYYFAFVSSTRSVRSSFLHFALTRVGSTGRSRATRRGAASAAPLTTSSSAWAVKSRSAARLTPSNGPKVTTKPSATVSTTAPGGGGTTAGLPAGRGGEGAAAGGEGAAAGGDGVAAGGDGAGPAGAAAAGAGRASSFRGAASDGAAPSRRGGSHTTTSVRDASVRFVPGLRRTGAVLGGCPERRCGGGQCFKSLSTAVCA